MASFCKHTKHRVIDDIWEPKWSTQEILIHTDKITDGTEHYVFRFAKDSPKQKYGWFYYSGKIIRRHKTQPNGSGRVYVVPLSKREDFVPMKQCEHEL